MKKLCLSCLLMMSLCACTTLSRHEEIQLRKLKAQGITVDRPVGNFEKPNSGAAAGSLNILPGIGNFYLAAGQGADSSQAIIGVVNLLCWPISILWAVPQAAVDANTLNKRELIYYYQYDPMGKKEYFNATGETIGE